MPSSASATSAVVSGFSRTFETWNRKSHYYLGLYLLFFLWLFLLTGLMLNHGRWFAIANQRVETKYERAIDVPTEAADVDRARDLMRQLRQRDIPGIAISGFGSAQDREEYLRAGFAESFVKPVDIDQLLAAIRRLTETAAESVPA